ncbi:MAG: sialate O-acetylesterase [Planctomycetota bacterium]
MKQFLIERTRQYLLAMVLIGACCTAQAELKVHGIFSDNMVIQRDKPIKVWGWAEHGESVHVKLGDKAAMTETNKHGEWSVTFDPQPANAKPQRLVVNTREEKIAYENIVVGDVWVMNGQSNMAWGMGKTLEKDLQAAQANLPQLRLLKISTNEQQDLQSDLPKEKLNGGEGWLVSNPETAQGISAIGYAFGSILQRSLGVPIGIIDNSRGGASIESLVPERKFADDPVATRYYTHIEERIASFRMEDQVAKLVSKWEADVKKKREQGVAEDKLPPKPTAANVRSWSIPGMSPSDAGACYNGMFGAFIGYNIKGVLFHQGYNNAIGGNCRPKRYRVLTRLMVEGWREDFNDSGLPVGIIGFCAGGIPQHDENFETWSAANGAYIRESQRLGLADVGDPENTAFLPAHDVKIPGLHPSKKKDHGERAARWALNRVYGMGVHWESAKLISTETLGDEIVLTFDQPVMPHDMSTIPKGFAVADEDGKYYKAYARFRLKKDQSVWNTANKSFETTVIHVWSPLVEKPIAVRYAWAVSPQSNLYVQGKPWAPLTSFRTDNWDLPESDDPAESAITRSVGRGLQEEAKQRNAERLQKEAEMGVVIMERLKTLGAVSD